MFAVPRSMPTSGVRENIKPPLRFSRPADRGAKTLKLAHDVVVPAVDVFNVRDCCFAISCQRRTDEGCARTEIRCGYLCPGQSIDAFDNRHAPRDLNVGAHSQQLIDVPEAAFVNSLGNNGGAISRRQHSGERLVHIRGESRMRRGLYIDAFWTPAAGHSQAVRIHLYLHSGFGKFVDYRAHVLDRRVLDQYIALRDARSNRERSCFHSIRDYVVFTATESLNTFNGNRSCSCTLYLRSQGTQEIRQIDNFRLRGAVLDDGRSFSEAGRGHEVSG